MTTKDLIERYYQGVDQTRKMDTYEIFFTNRKAREMVGFAPEHSWRKYVDATQK